MNNNEMAGELDLIIYTDPFDGEETVIELPDLSELDKLDLDNDDEIELRYIVTKHITVKDFRKGAYTKYITVMEVV